MIGSMIKNIFIPENIGKNYLFPKRIIGLDIGKTQIHATQIYLKGTTITIEKCLTVSLDNDTTIDYAERAAKAIKTIVEQLDRYDAIHTAIANPFVVFKELKLPFVGRGALSMVVDFEVEPLLPFALEDAIIDFIITKQLPEEKSSEVLIAAVQKQYIAQHLQPFAIAGIEPDTVIIDMFALYGLYLQIPSYTQLPGPVVLLDIGSQATHIAYIYNGQLRLIRSLPKGTLTIAKHISAVTELPINEATQLLARFGLEQEQDLTHAEAIKNAYTDFWHDISFTLTSFTSQFEQTSIARILLLGSGSEIKGLPTFISSASEIPCERFTVQELLQSKQVQMHNKQCASSTYIMSLSIAWPTPITAECNLRQKEFALPTRRRLFLKQIIIMAVLAIGLFSTLFIPNILHVNRIKREIRASEHEIVTVLKQKFRTIDEDNDDIDDVISIAEQEINKEEKLWFSLANPARSSFLKYLLEITTSIDKEALGFEIERLMLTETTMTLVAQVRDFEALSLLEKELKKSKLFYFDKGPNLTNFIWHIKLIKNGNG